MVQKSSTRFLHQLSFTAHAVADEIFCTIAQGSNEEVLVADVRRLLEGVEMADKPALPEQWSEVELTVDEISSTGDGLARKEGQVYVVPFGTPGDVVTAKVVRHDEKARYTLTDYLALQSAGPLRTEAARCRYFTACSGCQFQHVAYAQQLAHKTRVVEKAFAHFSGLPASAIPPVGDTVGSPLQYGYRTKLTPHFDAPSGARRDRRQQRKVRWEGVPPIGFMQKGARKTMDIEDCPIATAAVRHGMRKERQRVATELDTYQRGATLLLRESTERVRKGDEARTAEEDDVVLEDRGEWVHRKTCITDPRATSTEYVDDFRFDNPAGAFFQNNNSILPLVTHYIRHHILGPTPNITNLIDAYCGSGFFTITLSALFTHSIGIDISDQSIASASTNATLNALPATTTFLSGDAGDLFASIPAHFRPSETAVVLDPSRKGCGRDFIRQLLDFAPQRVCYVSCNVHSQARDVGWLVQGFVGDDGRRVEGGYEVESLRGFDFFPQTGHVEGVAMLRRRGE
ncbi:S-adenosyl-L-methionine-dependent methyltransferase [Teratosphaeria nubilosa]|uniref:S-adenosyl-L-methionine-dependent methyltransferase n=1 Tax=Teratosphaeria nubilosa TaxID=161662 RepID=A0A6G1LEQ7_9PEZI|nr:S-adenosyl-L-methionine-dependent methyltransferase [Teratosphaeria nubilosa]